LIKKLKVPDIDNLKILILAKNKTIIFIKNFYSVVKLLQNKNCH